MYAHTVGPYSEKVILYFKGLLWGILNIFTHRIYHTETRPYIRSLMLNNEQLQKLTKKIIKQPTFYIQHEKNSSPEKEKNTQKTSQQYLKCGH